VLRARTVTPAALAPGSCALEQFAKLRPDSGLACAEFEEAVRYETPMQTFCSPDDQRSTGSNPAKAKRC
jgi:hypothetical protein